MSNTKNDSQLKFEIYQELGECYTQVGDTEKAVNHFDEALKFNPQSERPHLGLGVIALQEEDFVNAEKHFLRALEINPTNDNALSGLGMVLSNNGGQEQGFARFQEALDVNPENMPALMGLLKSAYALNKLPIAETYLKKYLELHVADLKVLYCLAGVCFKLEKYKEAKDALEKILIFEPENQDAISMMREIKKSA